MNSCIDIYPLRTLHTSVQLFIDNLSILSVNKYTENAYIISQITKRVKSVVVIITSDYSSAGPRYARPLLAVEHQPSDAAQVHEQRDTNQTAEHLAHLHSSSLYSRHGRPTLSRILGGSRCMSNIPSHIHMFTQHRTATRCQRENGPDYRRPFQPDVWFLCFPRAAGSQRIYVF